MTKAVTLLIILCALTGARSQVRVNLAPDIELTFPAVPEVFDTLGQKVFNYSDENGYYACIIHKNAMTTGNMPMDYKAYYSNLFKSLQIPKEQCKLIRQTDLMIAGMKAAEFYSTCKEDPEFPEIRYIRLFLYRLDLYVLDYWTTKAHLASAEENKSHFLNSFVIHKNADAAVIPPAITKMEQKGTGLKPIQIGFIIIGIAGMLFLLWRFLMKKSPQNATREPENNPSRETSKKSVKSPKKPKK